MTMIMDWDEFSEEAMSHMSVRLEQETKMVMMILKETLNTLSKEDIRSHMDEVFEDIMDEFLGNLKEDILHERNNIIDDAIGEMLHGKEEEQ